MCLINTSLRLKYRNSTRNAKFCEGPSGNLEYLKIDSFSSYCYFQHYTHNWYKNVYNYSSFVGYTADINPPSFRTLNTETHSCSMTILNYGTNLHSHSVLLFLPAYNLQTHPCSTCKNIRKMDISKRIFQPALLRCLKFSLKGLSYSAGN